MPSKILDRHYKIGTSTDHRAKFYTGRPTHLGDLALKNKTSAVKLKSAPQAIASGGTNKWLRIVCIDAV